MSNTDLLDHFISKILKVKMTHKAEQSFNTSNIKLINLSLIIS